MNYFTINNNALSRNPTSVSNSVSKIENADRTMDGTMVIDVIAVKEVVAFTWAVLSNADVKTLVTEIKRGGFCTIQYYDPQTTGLKTITAQPGNLKYTPQYDFKSQSIIWVDVSVQFTER